MLDAGWSDELQNTLYSGEQERISSSRYSSAQRSLRRCILVEDSTEESAFDAVKRCNRVATGSEAALLCLGVVNVNALSSQVTGEDWNHDLPTVKGHCFKCTRLSSG